MQIRRLLTGAFALILVLGVAATARAQAQVSTGIVTGRVYNKATNEYLAGAQVSVEGTTLTTTTTAGGEFDIAGVPAGTATLHVVYPDTDPTDVTVAVSAGQSVSQEIGITNAKMYGDQTVKLDTFVVAGEFEGEAKSVAEQKHAINVVNVVDADQFPNIAGGSIGNFLQNLPGISIGYSVADPRTISVRGMDPSLVSVTVNGMRAASAASGNANRQFEMDQISMQDIARIEVTKTARPDQPADSAAGTINLVSRNAFEQKGMRMGYTADMWLDSDYYQTKGGTVNDGSDHTSQIRPGGNFFYSNSFVDNRLGIVFTANDNEFYTVSPAVTMSPTTVSTAFGISPLAPGGIYNAQFQYADGASFTRRHSVSFNIDFKASDNTVLFLNNQVNSSYIRSAGRGQSFTAAAPTTNAATTTNSVAPGYSDTLEVARGDYGYTTASTTLDTSGNYVTAYAGDLLNKSGAGTVFSGGSKTHIDTSNGSWQIDLTGSIAQSTNQYDLGFYNPWSSANNVSGAGLTAGTAGSGLVTAQQVDVGGATFYMRGPSWTLSTPVGSHYPTLLNYSGPDYTNLSNYTSYVSTSSTSSVQIGPNLGTKYSFSNPQYGPISVNNTRESHSMDRMDEVKLNVDRTFTTTIPFDIQAGFDIRHEYRNIDNNGRERYVLNPADIAATGAFGQFLEPTFERGNILAYSAPPMPSLTTLQAFANANPNFFQKDYVYEIQARDTGLRGIFEAVNGAYIESNIHPLKKLTILMGVRFEQTIDKGYGPIVNNSKAAAFTGQLNGVADPNDPNYVMAVENAIYGNETSIRKAYQNWFPNVQGKYDITPNLIARASFNETLGRQQLGNIMPGATISTSIPAVITVTNPGLAPILFTNYDVGLDYYMNTAAGVGKFTVDGYYKKIRNYVANATSPIDANGNVLPGFDTSSIGAGTLQQYAGGSLVEPFNVGKAKQVGLEIDYEQQLGGISQRLRDFSVYANYTSAYGESNAAFNGGSLLTNTKLPIVNLYPHQMNAGINFIHDPFQVTLKTNWWGSGEATSNSTFTYNESRSTVDAYFSYRFWKSNTFFIDSRNIFNQPLISDQYGPTRLKTYTLYGIQVYTGIKGTF